MKTLLPLLTLLVLLTLSSSSVLGPSEALKDGCCEGHTRVPVPKNKIRCVVMSNCKTKAVIVTAISGKQFCVDPEWAWSKNRLAEFNKTQTTSGKTANELKNVENNQKL